MAASETGPTPLVLFDATAVPSDRGGVGRYVDGLVHAIDEPIALVCQARDAAIFAELAPKATIIAAHRRIGSAPVRLLWEQVALPRLAKRIGARVIHSPHYTVPLLTRARRVVTFHDATFFSDPEVHTRIKGIFFRTWIRISARLASRIIVPSAATATELARFVAIADERVVVAHHGVDREVFAPAPSARVDAIAAKYGLPRAGWVLSLGTIEPRKNLPALVRAYAAIARTRPSIPPLVIAGGAGWETGLDDAIREAGREARITRLGFVPTDDLAPLLTGATVLAYPSLGEGFGLPVLEGLACGTAVLTTTRLALPEVGGEAVEYTEPDSESIEHALAGLLDSDARRTELESRALDRASLFTWEACAKTHLAAWTEASR